MLSFFSESLKQKKMVAKLFKVVQVINIIALAFLLLAAFGLIITGTLQVVAATLLLVLFPKNKLIYCYFALVGIFFLFWDGEMDWQFLLPGFLIIFLTFIIYKQKKLLK